MVNGKTALALLPGLLNDGALWQHQIAPLSEKAQPWVADFTSQDSIAAMAASVLEAMPERFALCGLSMGGYVAFEIMRQAPERVERLALLDTQARQDPPEIRQRRRDMMQLVEKGEFKGVTQRLLPQLVHPDRVKAPEVGGVVLGMAARVGKVAFLRQQTAILGRADSLPTLAQISCPTLVLCGEHDLLTPPERHLEMAAGIADARLVKLPDCGHLPPLERPEDTTAALLQWLSAE